jgi:hypothetical protein
MEITKQLSENEFVIDMGDEPASRNNYHCMVAHDYIRFASSTTIQTKNFGKVEGKHAGCSNNIRIPTRIQIGIRPFSEIILPHLNSREETKPEHYDRYNYNESSVTFFTPSGEKMISLVVDGKYETISYDLYLKLTGK